MFLSDYILSWYCYFVNTFQKNFFRNFISEIQSHQGLQGFAIFCRKNFFGDFFYFFRGFISASEEPEKGLEKGRKSIGKASEKLPKSSRRKDREKAGNIGIRPPQRGKGRKARGALYVGRDIPAVGEDTGARLQKKRHRECRIGTLRYSKGKCLHRVSRERPLRADGKIREFVTKRNG